MLVRLLLDLYAALVGLVAGSYLNVVIHRLPRGESTVLPRSRCPHCDNVIRPWDNIPVLSYLVLGGKCRDCKAPIAWRYPAVEAFTGLLFVACLEHFGPNPAALVAAGFCALLIALAGIDLEHFLLPDRLTLPGIAAGVALQPITLWAGGVTGGLLGAALGGGLLLAAYGAWWLIRREEGLGLGDVKMLAMVGAFLGWRGVVVTLFVGALSGSVVGVVLMARGQGDFKSRLPFGVFLAFGAGLALFFGPAWVESYLQIAFGPPLPP